MNEDKRIQKTKKSLKEALLSMLSVEPFERVTVTKLCDEANISRVTFYIYYDDKYSLLDELFKDLREEASRNLKLLEENNNAKSDPITSYRNLLKVIIGLYYDHFDFLRHTDEEESPYMYFSFYYYLKRGVEKFINEKSARLCPKYSIQRTSSFLCNGLWGYIYTARIERDTREEIEKESEELLEAILNCDFFLKN